ncbi:MAG: NADH dehydrogenase FAD-containing subunit, partial [Chlamydiota bacterium]
MPNILILVFLPLAAGLFSFFCKNHFVRRLVFVSTAFIHLILTLFFGLHKTIQSNDWFYLDPLGFLFLLITSILFFASSLYGMAYLRLEEKSHKKDFEEGFFFKNLPEAVFTGCILFFLATMTLVTMSQHFGMLWIGMEATTLFSAPLIYFHRNHQSLEATWKYLLICSVGIAL